jgi:hypothetical protein
MRRAVLDRWFHDYAGPNQFELHLAVTYVVREGALHGDPAPMFLDIHTIAAAREIEAE